MKKKELAFRLMRSAMQLLSGSAAIALLTFICYRLQARVTAVAFLYLIVIVALSVQGALVSSIVESIGAMFCLAYFFAKPAFSFRLDNPMDFVVVVAFVTTATTISLLVLQRKRAEEALRASEERRRAEQAEKALSEAQLALAHVTRVTTLGELMASISHEINQPLAGVVTNGQAGLRWLSQDPPQLDRARSSIERIVRDSNRASDLIQRVRLLAKKAELRMVPLDINEVIQEGALLIQREVLDHGVNMRTDFASALPRVTGDRVQLQQVIINLMLNSIEAMVGVMDRPREILVKSQQDGPENVVVAVRDSGIGIDPKTADQVFRAFFSTKPTGMGMGLSISRSIISSHGGRLWVSPNTDYGATFQFTLPIPLDVTT
jgi:C4-dicarboxylate-specific signal transduction histidine kinase